MARKFKCIPPTLQRNIHIHKLLNILSAKRRRKTKQIIESLKKNTKNRLTLKIILELQKNVFREN